LLATHIEKEKIESNDPIYQSIQTNKDNPIFLPPVLAVYVASYLNVKLHYEIL
jgi:hypothetical protein